MACMGEAGWNSIYGCGLFVSYCGHANLWPAWTWLAWAQGVWVWSLSLWPKYLDLAWVGLSFVDVACMSRVDLYLGLKGFSVSFPHRYSYLLLSFSDLKSILKKWLYFVFSFVWLSWLWLPPMVSIFLFLMCSIILSFLHFSLKSLSR